MPTTTQTLISRLRDTEGALLRQLESIDDLARGAGLPPHQLLDVNGDLVASSVLVALANVQVALAHLQPAVPPKQCGLTRFRDGRYPCVELLGHVGSHKDEDGETFR